MKKSTLSIISLTALLALTGCSKEATGGNTSECKFAPEAIQVNARSKALLVGETFELQPVVTPLIAQTAKLTYSTSNANVATVSSKGVIKAKGQGEAVITVSSASDETVNQSMTVYVVKEQKASKVKNRIASMAAYQEEYVETPRKVLAYETESREHIVDDQTIMSTTSYQKILIDKDEAFFYVGGMDTENRVANAGPVRSTFGYYIFTDEDYHSYLYHHTDNVKNRCYVATEFYLGTETERYEVVYAILNSLFTIGSDIAEDTISESLSYDWLTDYASSAKTGGYGDDMVMAEFRQSGGPGEQTTPEMEQNLDIPAYLPLKIKLTARVYWYKGNVKHYSLNFFYSYEYKEQAHQYNVYRDYTYFRDDEFEVVYPDRNEYQEVADIFEL